MRTALKWLGIGASVVVGLIIIGVAAVFALSNRALTRQYRPGVGYVAVPSDSASIDRGRHVVQAIGKCVDCHGEGLGGTMFIDGMPFARVAAPNLTRGRGGAAARLSDIDFVRAIRHGVLQDGRGAMLMPAEAYVHLTDEDLGAVIAYVKSVPAVDSAWPAPQLGPIGRMLVAFGQAQIFPAAYIDHERSTVIIPASDTALAYGGYLTRIGGCRVCHNEALSGGAVAGGPPSAVIPANLTPTGLAGWTEADFVRLLREGKRPDGRVLDNNEMPWRSSGRMTDAEIHVIWLFLQSLPGKELGQQ